MGDAWHQYNSVDGILFDEGSNGQMFLKVNWGLPHQPTWTIYDDVNGTEEAIHEFYETCEAFFTVFWTGPVDYDAAMEPWRIEAAEFNDAGQLLVLVRQEPGQFSEWSSVLELPSLNAFYAFFDNVIVAILEGWAANPVHPNWYHPQLPALDAEDEEMDDDDVQVVAVVQHQLLHPVQGVANQEGDDDDDDVLIVAFVQHNP